MNFFKLKEICQLLNGRAYKQEELLSSGKYKVLRVGNFFSDKDYFYSNLDLEENKYCDTGDLLFAWSASFGPKIWNGGKVIYHYHIWKIILSESVDKKYLYYYLFFMSERIKAEGHGGIMIHTTKQEMEERLIPLPPLDEQKRIAAVLDKCTAIIAKRKQQLSALDHLIKARFVEMFGAYNADCCKKKIGDYAQVLGGYAFKSDEFLQNAIPIIRISNINEGQIVPDPTICFTKEFWENNPKFRALPRDILMAMSGATTGKAGILRKNEPLLINQRVACIRANEGKAFPEFIYAATQLPWMYELIQEQSAGCAQPNISGKQIADMPIPEATYAQQQAFTSFVVQIEQSKTAVQNALDKTQTLFDSLMQQYFG